MYLLSLDEVDWVKRMNHISSTSGLAEKTNVSRKTWTKALSTREPSALVLQALANLGARPEKILVLEQEAFVA